VRRLPKPDLDPGVVYQSCVSGVPAADLAARFNAATADILARANLYEERADRNELHLFPSSPWGAGATVVLGELTKDELTDLYTSHMVKRDQPGRSFYDRIMLLAPLGKCPFCGFGHVSTLDHFLSKARYPSFSVLPLNLIPACTDCNKGKGSGVLDAHNKIPHPYFEDSSIETDVWLYASVSETSPATARFSVNPPDHWPPDLVRRVANYVHDLELTARFAIEAASELTSLSEILSRLETSQRIREYLGVIAQAERSLRKNSWKAALYEALSDSAWYREGGYRRPAT
jgi:5-methylcytosine-specific restriction endonuclease McrA